MAGYKPKMEDMMPQRVNPFGSVAQPLSASVKKKMAQAVGRGFASVQRPIANASTIAYLASDQYKPGANVIYTAAKNFSVGSKNKRLNRYTGQKSSPLTTDPYEYP